jgi:glycerol uptake facilitator protein
MKHRSVMSNTFRATVRSALAISGKFGWREVPGYIAAQVAGAIAGA